MSTATLPRPTRHSPTRHSPTRHSPTRYAHSLPATIPTVADSARCAANPRRRGRYEAVGPAGRRPGGSGVAASTWVAGTHCAASGTERRVVARRRATAAALMLGGALALLVWAVAVIGSNYAASVQPAPTGTEIVHVRQGDSLSSIADRIAPDVPRQAVIDRIVERNGLAESGLRVGQALVAPAYG